VWNHFLLEIYKQMKNPLVYIIVLNYRNYNDTIDCVHSVEKINYPNYRIVLIDNNSGNSSEQILRREFPHHTLFKQEATGVCSG
jgi:GT2 family glycosyltransferase